MTSKSQDSGYTDPTQAWRTMRDQAMESWAKSMSDFVGTDAFAQSLGGYLDSYLTASSQFQKAMDQYMKASLAMLSMPSRDDVTNMAQRITSIEMRLDDLAFAVDEAVRVNRDGRKREGDDQEALVRSLQAELKSLGKQLSDVAETSKRNQAADSGTPERQSAAKAKPTAAPRSAATTKKQQ